jgi:PAS domain S-box-containing protein
MKKVFRFMDWPLRAKMAALLVVASLFPMAIAALIDVRQARERLTANTASLLAARGDQLADQLDTFHRGYQRSARRIASLPHSTEFFRVEPDKIERVRPVLRIILDTFPTSDANIRGAAILDLTGVVKVATEEQLIGMDLSFHRYLSEALRGQEVISNIHFGEREVGFAPTIAYVAPVIARDGKMVGFAALWVRAEALWKVMKESNELAGPHSYAVLFDQHGIRIAHTYSDEIVFHPGGQLATATIDSMVAERRFGESTRALLEDVRAFPEQFNRALSASPDLTMFRGFAPVTQKWNYGVARRFETVPWTVFYMVPEDTLNAQIAAVTRKNITFAGAIILAALAVGALFARLILKPVGSLSNATLSIANGDFAARVPAGRADELGRLGVGFNSMAERIQTQAAALQKARDELELRVEQRTEELVQTARDLEAEIIERKRNEMALAESRERTRAVVDTAIDGIIGMNHEGRIVDFNPAAERIFNHRSEDVVGRELADVIIPPALREGHRRGLAKYLATGEGPVLGKRLELTAVRADGTEFPVELSITRVGSAEPPLFTGFLRDISERKSAEQALRESQQLLRAIIDNSTALVYVKDLQGRYLLINRRYEEIFHLTSDAALGKTDDDLFPRELADAFRAVDQRVLASGVVQEAEEVAPQDDGLHTYISIKCPLFDMAGKPYAMCGISTDITERKLSEVKLQEQLGRLNLLHQITRATGERQDLQSILQVVIRSLEDNLHIDFGCVCLHDRVAETLTVTSIGVRSEALAMELAMTKEARVPIDQNGLSRCVRGQLVYEPDIAAVEFPFPQRLARGGLRSLVVAPLLVESHVFGVLVAARREPHSFSSGECEFLRQLSEHVGLAAHQAQLYDALQQAYDDLRQTQQAVMQQERLRSLGQMASGIAHDINNAISPVALYTESLLTNEPNLSARTREYLETIQRAIDDVAATVSRMREFYRQREPQFTLVAVSLNELVQQVINFTRARWSDMQQRRGIVIQMQTELAPDLPVVMGIEGEIREALTNLIFNAVDAMPEGGTLTLRTRVAEGAPESKGVSAPRLVHLEVADSGSGMDEETRRRCLEPFFTTKGERGTGLGLAMVYGVAQRHSADIEIESAPGQGTTVRLSFRLPDPSTSGLVLASRNYAVPGRLRLLVVDDDPLLLKSLRDTLESGGHVVVTANGGQMGIDAFRAALERGEPFGAVITDLGMPNVDGRKVASAIKASSPSTPVILLTGWGQRLVDEGDIPPHVDLVLGKPPKLNQLHDALAHCCGAAES